MCSDIDRSHAKRVNYGASLQTRSMGMCDYSLHGIKNRLAEEGETLIVHRFRSGSKGLTSPQYLDDASRQGKGWIAAFKKIFATPPEECAVCVPEGAKLMLHGISRAFQQAYAVGENEPVIFRQLSLEATTYRDAVEFKNGVKVRIQELEDSQTAEVISLSSEEVQVARASRTA
jgi:hypothetical protein